MLLNKFERGGEINEIYFVVNNDNNKKSQCNQKVLYASWSKIITCMAYQIDTMTTMNAVSCKLRGVKDGLTSFVWENGGAAHHLQHNLFMLSLTVAYK